MVYNVRACKTYSVWSCVRIYSFSCDSTIVGYILVPIQCTLYFIVIPVQWLYSTVVPIKNVRSCRGDVTWDTGLLYEHFTTISWA